MLLGLVLIVGAIILAPPAYLAVRAWLRPPAPEPAAEPATLRPSELHAHVGRDVAVLGRAIPERGTPLESRLAGAECVWHRHEVRRHYWVWRTGTEDGERYRERRCDSIADHDSPDPFALVDAGPPSDGPADPVLVRPADADTAGLHMCLQRVVGRPQRGSPSAGDDLLPRVQGQIMGVFRGETIEFEYLEWVVRPGDRLLVHGRVAARDGRTVLTAPEGGNLRIEHAAEPEAPEPAVAEPRPGAARALLLTAGTVAVLSVGLLFTVAGF